jgi:hypothetical protein
LLLLTDRFADCLILIVCAAFLLFKLIILICMLLKMTIIINFKRFTVLFVSLYHCSFYQNLFWWQRILKINLV